MEEREFINIDTTKSTMRTIEPGAADGLIILVIAANIIFILFLYILFH